jgi:hypothetical protein
MHRAAPGERQREAPYIRGGGGAAAHRAGGRVGV